MCQLSANARPKKGCLAIRSRNRMAGFAESSRLRCMMYIVWPCLKRSTQLGQTALICAAFKGQTEMSEMLLDRGADIEAKDNVRALRALHLNTSRCFETRDLERSSQSLWGSCFGGPCSCLLAQASAECAWTQRSTNAPCHIAHIVSHSVCRRRTDGPHSSGQLLGTTLLWPACCSTVGRILRPKTT